MRMVKYFSALMVLSALIVFIAGCAGAGNDQSSAENQTFIVVRGNISQEITAAGNLSLSLTEDLAFDTAGTVEAVLVKTGDTVTENQTLARLDTAYWEDTLTGLESAVTSRERDLLQAQINLNSAQQNLKNALNSVDAAALSVNNSDISVKQAEINLDTALDTYSWPALEHAEQEVTNAETYLEFAMRKRHESTSNSEWDRWDAAVQNAIENLAYYQARIDDQLARSEKPEVLVKRLQLESAQTSLTQARENLEDAGADIANKQLALTLTQGRYADAEIALKDAEEELADAHDTQPLIKAPFAGFVTQVNVEGGDEVLKGTMAVVIADPAKFEAEILVSEIDILSVELGGRGSVSLDAMTGLTVPATVTHISPTATIQSGVVNYQVTVELASLDAAVLSNQQASVMARVSGSGTGVPRGLGQMPGDEPAADETQSATPGSVDTAQTTQEIQQLREGLTATVNIFIDNRQDVILVPNNAVSAKGAQSAVTVLLADGTSEIRMVETGLANWQYTEIISGLEVGETVVLPSAVTTSSSSQPGQSNSFRLPGMGGIRR
ncbi:efflux RND transporter periplasmic adaptor subunit [Chloroflexota bacterium]